MSLSQALNQFAQNLGRYLPIARRRITRESVDDLQIPFRFLCHRKLRNRDGQMTTVFA